MLASVATSRLNPQPADLSGAAIDVAAGLVMNTTPAIEYSLNSTDGMNGSWTAANAGNTTVSITAGKVYVREAANPANVRLAATIAAPAAAPAVTVDVSGGVTAAKLIGATTAMEYSTDGGSSWQAVTTGLVSGTDSLNLGGTTADLRIRVAATANALASEATNRLNSLPLTLSAVGIDAAAGKLEHTSNAMEYSLDSTNGADGHWTGASMNETVVTFLPGKVYVREAGNPTNVRLVATIPVAAGAPSVTVSVYGGDSAAVLVGATTAMEYSLDGGVSWQRVTQELAAGTDTLNLSEFTTDLRVRTAATATHLASLPSGRLYSIMLSNDATILSISLSGLTLTSTVSSNVYQYTALDTFASSTTASTVTGSVYASTTIKLNGVPTQNPLNLIIGTNTISFEITAQDGVSKLTYTVTVRRLKKSNGNSSSGSNSSPGSNPSSGGSPESGGNAAPSNPSGGLDIFVDGVKQDNLAAAKTEITNGKETTVVVVDSEKVMAKLEQGDYKVVSIPVAGNHTNVVGELNGRLVKMMGDKDAVIEISTNRAIYTIPASLIGIVAASQQLAAGDQFEAMKIAIRIAEPADNALQQINNAALKGGQTVVVPPIDFEITVVYGDKQLTINHFNEYVERFIAIPDGIDASRITTGVVLNADGTLSHVPTKVVMKDGKYYARINSLTNSTYSVIWNPRSFEDVENHWSKADVNDMAGRLVVQGISDRFFEPERNVTRAEFAAVAVRALGLKPQAEEKIILHDVHATDWYADFVAAAVSNGLIDGYEDGTFRPDRTISRNEAAVILSRAMEITKVTEKLTTEEIDKRLAAFKDGNIAAEWAKPAFAAVLGGNIVQGDNGFIYPEDSVSRAQSAAMFRRLLQAAELINP